MEISGVNCSIKGVSTESLKVLLSSSDGRVYENVKSVVISNSPKLEFLPRGLLKLFPYLNYLEISETGLKLITREDLAGAKYIEDFYLKWNKIRSIPLDLFLDMKLLKRLYISDRNLVCFSSKTLKPILGRLEKLHVDKDQHDPSVWMRTIQYNLEFIDKTFCPPEENSNSKAEEPDETDQFALQFAPVLMENWKQRQYSDFTVIAGDSKQFKVHKNIIGPQSQVFATSFKVNMKEKQTGTMKIVDFDSDVVEGMLHWMYTGTVLDETLAPELYKIAARFGVQTLMNKAEAIIVKKVDEVNALEILQLGTLFSNVKIKKAALKSLNAMF